MTGSRGMWLKAKDYEDRYLLPHRHHRRGNEQWRAAEWLVENGYARWLPLYSCYAPGIELTTKPWPQAT